MKSFVDSNIYMEGKGVIKTSISFDSRIKSESVCGEQIKLPSGAIVLPGFIDTHIHGAGGADVMDGTQEALKTMAECVCKEGTARFYATTMTQSKDNVTSALRAVNKYSNVSGAKILGVHLEGPFISLKHAGAQPPQFVQEPSIERFNELQKAAGGMIKIVTVAPECNGALPFIEYLIKSGVTVSVGHTDAGYTDVLKAVNAGANAVTHTFNAQRPLHHRDIGTVGSAMLIDELYTELIADTVHVSLPAVKLLVKNKPQDKLVLITDSMRAKGMGDCVSELGGQTVIVKNGEARLKDGTLAGSVLTLNTAVKNLTRLINLPLTNAVDCVTANPARRMGIYDNYGSIKVGKVADFTVIDGDFNVIYTIADGEIVYKAS